MRQTVEQWISERNLLNTGDRVLIAVSGGPDSMALLHLCKALEEDWRLDVSAAHVNHGLRAETAAEDEMFVQTWCAKHGIPFFSTFVSVENERIEKGGSVQEQARRLRYDYLARIMQEQHINVLATGHHADDQIETVLMKQASGRAILGEPAMKPWRRFAGAKLIRPLLTVTKEHILTYCEKHSISFQTDESNVSDKYTRNRFRHHILPFLKQEDSLVHRHFQNYADWAGEEREYIEKQAEKEWTERIIQQDEHSVTISTKGMEALPLPLQRRGIPLILRYLYIHRVPDLSVVHIDQFLNLINQKHPSSSLDWPGGVMVTRSYETVTFSLKNEFDPTIKVEPTILSLPGHADFGNKTFSAQYLQAEDVVEKDNMLICDVDKVTFPLTIRPRLPGDKIQPLGMKGSKKVNRIFIEKKIPRKERVNWPVVIDAHGDVVWVPLLKKSTSNRKDRGMSKAACIVMTCSDF